MLSSDELNTCSKCSTTLGSVSHQFNKWSLNCGHVLCACCITRLLDYSTKHCPCCGVILASLVHVFYKPAAVQGRSRLTRLLSDNTSTKLKQITTSVNLLAENEETILTVTTASSSQTILLKPFTPLTTQDESVLECIFQVLHSFVVPKIKVQYKKAKTNDADMKGTYWDRMESLIRLDTSLLNRLLTKLAWGDNIMHSKDENACKAQIFVAAESIRGAKEVRSSLFRTLVTNAMCILGKVE